MTDQPATPQDVVYRAADRPDVEVLLEDGITWVQGELRMWTWRNGWWGNVQYRAEGGSSRVDTLPHDRIRAETQPDVRRSGRPPA